MSTRSCRVWMTSHHDGRRTGALIRHGDTCFSAPPPRAWADDDDAVLADLAAKLRRLVAEQPDELPRYLWTERFETRRVRVDVHPRTTVGRQEVIGKDAVPLDLTYGWCESPPGAYRIVLPRHAWWMIVEDLDCVPELLAHHVASILAGEDARSLYDFRREGTETVVEWAPSLLSRPIPRLGPHRDEDETLTAVADDWFDLARRHKLPSPLGVPGARDTPADHRELILQQPPRSILLIGPPGVGKTTWARRLAHFLVSASREPETEDVPRLWATSAHRIIAGMVYLGMWQARCLEIVSALAHRGDYLFVDRLVDIVARRGDGSIAEVFAPAVEAQTVSLVAECTPEEFVHCRRDMSRLVDAFEPIRITPPSPLVMPELLARAHARAQARACDETAPALHASAWKRIVDHLDWFIRDSHFPGKGLRFVDWLHRHREAADLPRTLYPHDASLAFARYTGLPVELICDDHGIDADAIATQLREHVIGQANACRAAAEVLARFKAGLDDPDRPSGSLLFVGPTGVGKTELAKQLAAYLFGSRQSDAGTARLIRLDMSEYMLPGASHRLIHAGDGARSLATQVRQQPLSIVLLDEIEKAHPEVFDVLLGVLGDGRLTDDRGRTVDFRMTLVIMTSNLGVTHGGNHGAIGFTGRDAPSYEAAVRRHFRPELFNRIDHIVAFDPLSQTALRHIVDLELEKARARTGLTRRRIRLSIEREVRDTLALAGYDPERGARPLRRVIEERVMTPIAVRIAAHPDLRNCTLTVLLHGGPAWNSLSPTAREETIIVPRLTTSI